MLSFPMLLTWKFPKICVCTPLNHWLSDCSSWWCGGSLILGNLHTNLVASCLGTHIRHALCHRIGPYHHTRQSEGLYYCMILGNVGMWKRSQHISSIGLGNAIAGRSHKVHLFWAYERQETPLWAKKKTPVYRKSPFNPGFNGKISELNGKWSSFILGCQGVSAVFQPHT